jgi:glycosyltransferase involved in cell wall biosynthesis
VTKRTPRNRALSIGLCIIARDEERFIGDCIDSAKPFVQELIVLDTGSIDRTREIAREHGARVEHFTWCDDFAAARNAAVDLATTDWILMLDADEQLAPDGAELLQQYARMAPVIPNGINGFCPTIVSQQLDGQGGKNVASRVMRFFPRLPGMRWAGAIHEDLQFQPEPGRLRSVSLEKVRIIHYGYDSSVYLERGKDARNTYLLEQALERNPEDARTIYFLGLQHIAMRRNAQSIPYLRSFLERADQAPRDFTVEAFAMLIKALAMVGDLAGVDEVALRGEAHNLLSADAREALARVEERRKRLDLAEKHLLRALEPGQPVGVSADEGTGTWATRLHLARIHESRGQPHLALEDIAAAFGDLDHAQRGHVALEAAALALRFSVFEPAKLWLARAARYMDQTETAQQRLMELWIELFKRCPQAAAQTDHGLPIEAAVARQDWQSAYEAALSMDVESPRGIGQILYVAHGLKQAGALDAALDVLDRVVENPDLPKTGYWLLVSTLTAVGRYEDADAALNLMQLRGIGPELAQAA